MRDTLNRGGCITKFDGRYVILKRICWIVVQVDDSNDFFNTLAIVIRHLVGITRIHCQK